MKRLPVITHSLFSELLDQCRAEPRNPDLWPLSGNIVTTSVDGRKHWYYQESRRLSTGRHRQREYLGPVSDQVLAQRVRQFESAKSGHANRAEIISTLKSSGVAAPTGKLANLLLGLHEAGVLEKAILVGTVAFQAYGAMLGAKFGQSAFYTMDVDMTQADTISMAMTESSPAAPLLDILKKLDATFSEVPGMDPRTPPVSYMNKDRIRLDVLMPFSGPEQGPIRSSVLQSHGYPQRFLDYLIIEPVETVMLIGGGALTHVPAPARFALHKLIVSRRRGTAQAARRRKDLLQAQQLIELLIQDDPEALVEAQRDLKERGPKWRKYFEEGLRSMDDQDLALEAEALFREA